MYPGPTLTAMVPLFISFWSNYHWLAAFLIGSALALLAYWTDAFGFGDVELLTILTLWFGLEFVLQSLLAGCILCLIGYAIKKIRRPHSILRGDQIPFIPYISMGVVVVMAF
jgi:leader peptidase (prepilin peptidase)/N-methyltransferase